MLNGEWVCRDCGTVVPSPSAEDKHSCQLPINVPPGQEWVCPNCTAVWCSVDIGVRLGMWQRNFDELRAQRRLAL